MRTIKIHLGPNDSVWTHNDSGGRCTTDITEVIPITELGFIERVLNDAHGKDCDCNICESIKDFLLRR